LAASRNWTGTRRGPPVGRPKIALAAIWSNRRWIHPDSENGGHGMFIVPTTVFLSRMKPFLTAVKEMTKGHVFDEELLSSRSGPAQGLGWRRFQAVGHQHKKTVEKQSDGRIPPYLGDNSDRLQAGKTRTQNEWHIDCRPKGRLLCLRRRGRWTERNGTAQDASIGFPNRNFTRIRNDRAHRAGR
jgi:hypothetical protein